MNPWTVRYDNETGPDDDSFHEFWIVSDGVKDFESDNKNDAVWLCTALNEYRCTILQQLPTQA